MLFLTHNAPHPALSDGTGTELNGTAPRMSCAFILAPYIYGSLPFTIPHCIRSAAVPVTNGAAMDVPLWAEYPPPGAGDIIFTPGATISGFTVWITLVYPRPEKSAYEPVRPLYAPTVITLYEVDGIVNVTSGLLFVKPVSLLTKFPAGSHI